MPARGETVTFRISCGLKCGATITVPTVGTTPELRRGEVEAGIIAQGWACVAGPTKTAAVCPACTPKMLQMVKDAEEQRTALTRLPKEPRQ